MIKSEVANAIFDGELARLKEEGYEKLAKNAGETTHRNMQGPDGKTYEIREYVSDTATPGWLLVTISIGGRLAMRAYQVVVGPNGEFVDLG